MRRHPEAPALSPAGRGIWREFEQGSGVKLARLMFIHDRQANTQSGSKDTMRRARHFHVYIMTNGPRFHVLYTGITGNIARRVFEHKNKLTPGFTSRYNLMRLVYYEGFAYPDLAIDREKEIKGWRRSKKIRLIESMNPHWYDLAEHWMEAYKPEGTPREIPHPAELRRVSG